MENKNHQGKVGTLKKKASSPRFMNQSGVADKESCDGLRSRAPSSGLHSCSSTARTESRAIEAAETDVHEDHFQGDARGRCTGNSCSSNSNGAVTITVVDNDADADKAKAPSIIADETHRCQLANDPLIEILTCREEAFANGVTAIEDTEKFHYKVERTDVILFRNEFLDESGPPKRHRAEAEEMEDDKTKEKGEGEKKLQAKDKAEGTNMEDNTRVEDIMWALMSFMRTVAACVEWGERIDLVVERTCSDEDGPSQLTRRARRR
jgi:hypothetical protein